MKKEPAYIFYLSIIWAAILIIAIVLTLTSTEKDKNRLYDMQIEAATKTLTAYEAIKKRKEELGIAISEKDIFDSGLLGDNISPIQTTMGKLEAKRTSINPNFAAVYIQMFKEAGLKEGDQIAIVLSGSFPALNISLLIATEVYGLTPCVMSSIGSSTYGANNPDFTYFDMAEYLYHNGLMKNRIDYVSLGGANDIGDDFWTEDKMSILERIDNSGVNFIYEPDYKKNIEYRLKVIYQKCPDLKLFANVGGNLVAMGVTETTFLTKNGLVMPSYMNTTSKETDGIGLLDYFSQNGLPVIHMLNIKGLALKYEIPYDPLSYPEIGISEVYYEQRYSLTVPIVALSLSVALLVLYYIYRKRKNN